MIRWFDYIAVFLLADLFASTIMHNIFMIWLPVLLYWLYEQWRVKLEDDLTN